MFYFGSRSEKNLTGVNPELVKVVRRALEISELDFAITEGFRSKERQKMLVKIGASQTMNSKHLTGNAVDLAAYYQGAICWDWPLYAKLADAMKQAAYELDVAIVWGGDWKTFKDGCHFQVSNG